MAALMLAGQAGLAWQRTRVERDRAVQAERTAAATLARSLTATAARALDRGALPEAEVLASEALVLGDDPAARGVLAGAWAASRPPSPSVHPLPGCDPVEVDPAHPRLACLVEGRSPGDPAHVEVWWLDPPHRTHTVELDAVDATFVGERLVVGIRPEGPDDDPRVWQVDLAAAPGSPEAAPVPTPHRLTELEGHPTGLLARRRHTRVHLSPAALHGGVEAPPPTPLPPSLRDWYDGHGVSPDGTRLATLVDGRVHSGPIAGPLVPHPRVPDGLDVAALALADDGTLLVGTWTGRLVVVPPARTPHGAVHTLDAGVGPIRGLAVAAHQVAVRGEAGTLHTFDRTTGVRGLRIPAAAHAEEAALRWLDGGRTLAVVGGDEVSVWRRPAWPRPHRIRLPRGLASATFGPTGRWLYLTASGGLLHRADLAGGTVHTVRRDDEETVKDVAVVPGHGATPPHLLAVGTHRHARRHHLDLSPAQPPALAGPTHGRRIVWLDDGRALLASYSPTVRQVPWHVDGPPARALPRGPRIRDAEARADHREAVLVDADAPAVWLWRRGEDGPHTVLPLTTAPQSAALHPRGHRIALGGVGGVTLVDRSGTVRSELMVPGVRADDLAFSHDGRWLAMGGDDGRTRVWSVATGHLAAELGGHRRRVAAVAFAPDDQSLITASWDATVRRWATAPLAADPAVLRAHAATTWGLTPDQVLTSDLGVPGRPEEAAGDGPEGGPAPRRR